MSSILDRGGGVGEPGAHPHTVEMDGVEAADCGLAGAVDRNAPIDDGTALVGDVERAEFRS